MNKKRTAVKLLQKKNHKNQMIAKNSNKNKAMNLKQIFYQRIKMKNEMKYSNIYKPIFKLIFIYNI